ncbi:MAG TPA: twin-arginine translocation signal domain-containing protein [Kofleriaceae bacterium]|nr:twin-arginine translocation signal domain-containing protein [Kofleriaceae bacterium]
MPPAQVNRRQLLKLAGAGGAVVAAAACGRGDPEHAPVPAPAVGVDRPVIRVASVPTAVEGNVLPALIADFERRSHYRVELTTSPGLYGLARAGQVDLLISHYGHRDAEQFVIDGLGEWPRTLFSNQMALLGPPGDPAGVRGLADAGEAFRKIAAARSPFVLNNLDGVHYLTEILWHAAGRPDRTGWFVDLRESGEVAIDRTSQLGGYSLWGLTPFLRLRDAKQLRLEPLVIADPLLQRMLVSIIVKPGIVKPGIVKPGKGLEANTVGAGALQRHLLLPETQARIREISYPGADGVMWVPGGRHNRTAVLPT